MDLRGGRSFRVEQRFKGADGDAWPDLLDGRGWRSVVDRPHVYRDLIVGEVVRGLHPEVAPDVGGGRVYPGIKCRELINPGRAASLT